MLRSAEFQSTHSRGVRREIKVKCHHYLGFQSTHSRGVRRRRRHKERLYRQISIHALTWSATFTQIGLKMQSKIFQSTHSRGVRLISDVRVSILTLISIHALTWSATLQTYFIRPQLTFQSTHSRGVRPHDIHGNKSIT